MKLLVMLIVFLPFILGIAVFAAGKISRKAGNIAAAVAAAAVACITAAAVFSPGAGEGVSIAAMGLSFSLGGFRSIYALVIALMWLASALISPEYFSAHGKKTPRYYFFLLATLGATMGVFLSADLYTTFLFFEIMSLTSYAWVVQEETDEALAAGKTYLTIAVAGGMAALMGLFILYGVTGTLEIDMLYQACAAAENKGAIYAASFCLLAGFGAKAGLYPLHIWLPKAHPVAPAPASALLSGVLTKAGLFGVIVITAQILRHDPLWGKLLLVLGLVTMVLGALLALFSNNIKYVLACSSLSQIGFITVGISMVCLLGEENALAANGVVLYMLNHSLVKLTLFLCAGVIYMNTHSLDLNEIRGFGRGRPLLCGAFAVGGLSLAGIPLFCGYVSKTLVHEAIVEYAASAGSLITAAEWLFLVSGGITLAYVTKLFVAIFVEKPAKQWDKKPCMNLASGAAVLAGPVLLLAIGVFPNAVGDKIGASGAGFLAGAVSEHAVNYFSAENLRGIAISAAIGLLVYFAVVRGMLLKNGKYRAPHLGVSLEKHVYVPFFSVLIAVIVIICRAVADLPALILLGIKYAFFKGEREKLARWHPWLVRSGNLWDRLKGREQRTSAGALVNAYSTIHDTTDRILSNLSFALLMTCLGICIVLVFLLIK